MKKLVWCPRITRFEKNVQHFAESSAKQVFSLKFRQTTPSRFFNLTPQRMQVPLSDFYINLPAD
jgi:hypothetical protein